MATLPPSETPIYDELATKYNAKALFDHVFEQTGETEAPLEPIGVNIGTE